MAAQRQDAKSVRDGGGEGRRSYVAWAPGDDICGKASRYTDNYFLGVVLKTTVEPAMCPHLLSHQNEFLLPLLLGGYNVMQGCYRYTCLVQRNAPSSEIPVAVTTKPSFAFGGE